MFIKNSILLPNGRVGFHAEPLKGIESAYKLEDQDGQVTKTAFETADEFAAAISKFTGVKVPQELLSMKKTNE